jgi:hypothetical protein
MTTRNQISQKDHRLENKIKSRKFLGGLSFIFYLFAAYEFFLGSPGNHARASLRSLEIIFGPHVFVALFASMGTLCLLLIFANERS